MRNAVRGTLRLSAEDLDDVENVVDQLRFTLGIEEHEIARISDAWRLVPITPGLEVELRAVSRGASFLCGPHDYLAWLPESWDEGRLERALLEECGHVFLTVRAFDQVPDERGASRLYRLWEQRDESKIRAFVLCWLIPRALLLEYMGREAELAELCRCTEQEVWDRLELWG